MKKRVLALWVAATVAFPAAAAAQGLGIAGRVGTLGFGGDVAMGVTERLVTPQALGTLTGVVDSRSQAPYVLIGLGKHTSAGMGLSVDLGVAFLGD